MRKIQLLSVLALAAVVVVIVVAARPATDVEATGSAAGGETPVVVVGSANFPENALLAEMYAAALRAAGLEVRTTLNVGSREVLFPAMEDGEITVVPEYTGALLAYLDQDAEPASTTEAQVTQLRDVLPAGLRLLNPSAAQDQETVTCRGDVVERYDLTSLADLGPVSGELIMGGPPELAQRTGRFSLPGLKEAYGIEFAEFKPLDVAGPLTVAALREGKIDCANLFSTQSAIVTNGFISLEDPEGLIESQAVVPLIVADVATPQVVDALDLLSAQLTTENLKEMVKQVEVDKIDPAAVAGDFLASYALD